MFFPIGLAINDRDFIYAGAGNAKSGTTYGAPSGETYFINEKVATRNGYGNITFLRGGSVTVIYSASGFSNTAAIAYSGRTRIDLQHDGTWTTVGSEQTSARIAVKKITIDVEAGDSLRVYTRAYSSAGESVSGIYGGYSWAVAFVPNEPAAASEE